MRFEGRSPYDPRRRQAVYYFKGDNGETIRVFPDPVGNAAALVDFEGGHKYRVRLLPFGKSFYQALAERIPFETSAQAECQRVREELAATRVYAVRRYLVGQDWFAIKFFRPVYVAPRNLPADTLRRLIASFCPPGWTYRARQDKFGNITMFCKE